MKTKYIKPTAEVFFLRPLNLLFEVSDAESRLSIIEWGEENWEDSEEPLP